jgi:hypothetical protein
MGDKGFQYRKLYKFARFTLIEWHVRQEGARSLLLFVSDVEYNAPKFMNTQAGFALTYRFSHCRSRKTES